MPENKTQTGSDRKSFTLPWQNTFSLRKNGSLVFRWRNCHPRQSLGFLSCFSLYKQLVRNQVFPVVASNITNCPQSSKRWVHSCRRCSIAVYNSESKLNSVSGDETEMKIGRLSPKIYHFLEKIQRADWGAIVLGSWEDVISNRRPRLPKTHTCNTSRVTLKGHRILGIQPNMKIFSPKYFTRITGGFLSAKNF